MKIKPSGFFGLPRIFLVYLMIMKMKMIMIMIMIMIMKMRMRMRMIIGIIKGKEESGGGLSVMLLKNRLSRPFFIKGRAVSDDVYPAFFSP